MDIWAFMVLFIKIYNFLLFKKIIWSLQFGKKLSCWSRELLYKNREYDPRNLEKSTQWHMKKDKVLITFLELRQKFFLAVPEKVTSWI